MFFKDYEVREIVFNSLDNFNQKSVDIFRRELTYGKCYTAYVLANEEYYFMNDLGYFAGYSSHFFLTVDEWRERQIEKLLV